MCLALDVTNRAKIMQTSGTKIARYPSIKTPRVQESCFFAQQFLNCDIVVMISLI
jgi:hypothetical protein